MCRKVADIGADINDKEVSKPMSALESSPKLFLTVTETATALRVDAATIYRAIRAGTFPAVRVRGRYVVPVRAVEELASRAVETGACVDASDVAVHQPQPARDAVPHPRAR